MSLEVGSRLGPYEVHAAIGAGGMGEVYRGRDTRLHRDVAIKVLPEAFAADAERLARFEREAQVLAALNHPNIAAIYGLEEGSVVGAGLSRPIRALILEYVEGPTLADRLAHGPIPLDEALPIARQIAEALEAAHEQGIVHRDLKPANIKLRPDGTVKVLDFGLAKALDVGADFSRPDISASPTITSPAMMTGVGMILGTAAYMSPEQARGKPVSKRTDIWAFGCVCYEMLTGRRAFAGDEITDTLAEVLKSEPDWNALPASTPSGIRRLLRQCLMKDPRQRLPDAAVVRLEIDDPAGRNEAAASVTPRLISATGRGPWIGVAAILVVIAALAAGTYLRPRGALPPAYRALLDAPENSAFVYPGNSPAAFMALSPDGRQLAFVGSSPATQGAVVWVRRLDEVTARPLAGTDGASYPFWSPDVRFLAFFAAGKLKRIAVAGGPAIDIADAQPVNAGGTWNQNGEILFRPAAGGPLFRTTANGARPTPVTALDASARETLHTFPSFLPDGRHFLFATLGESEPDARTRGAVFVGSLDSSDRTKLLDVASNAQYADGHLLFTRANALIARPFDHVRREFTGEESIIAEQISSTGGGATALGDLLEPGAFSISQTGVLTYRTGTTETLSQLIWFDRAGRQLNTVAEPGDYIDLELSPDQRQAAVSALDAVRRTRDLWLFDLARGLRTTRLTSHPASDQAPIWSPDGLRIAFLSGRGGPRNDLRVTAADGSGGDDLLGQGNPRSWSRDGKYLLYNIGGAQTGADLWVLPLESGEKPRPFVNGPFAEPFGRFSDDLRWVAFHSNESGRNEVYASAFPGPGPRLRVSTSGGWYPRWSRDGREIFYLDLDGRLSSARIDGTSGALSIGDVTALFQARPRIAGYPYDVSDDGERFLVNTLMEAEGSPRTPNAAGRTPITLVVNWPTLVARP